MYVDTYAGRMRCMRMWRRFALALQNCIRSSYVGRIYTYIYAHTFSLEVCNPNDLPPLIAPHTLALDSLLATATVAPALQATPQQAG